MVEISKKILEYIENFNSNCYIQIGNKQGNSTPAFSMDILPADSRGHMKIEVDIEIADNNQRLHRCSFFINSELGVLGEFGKKIPSAAQRKYVDRFNFVKPLVFSPCNSIGKLSLKIGYRTL